MAKVTRIGTNGYRGPGTGYGYLPPGEYEVGGEQVSETLAAYLLSIGLAWPVEHAPEGLRKSARTQHRGNKIVELDTAGDDTGGEAGENAGKETN